MKQILIILGLFASVTTFAQSPRIKLNQITKDTVKGSVLISSPTDSGMVYSRDFYIAYGADTVLILYGDTLAATSGIISSVLSDGVTVLGDGTTGNELKVDTSLIATLTALNDSLATVPTKTTPDSVTITGDGSVGNPLKVDTATVISTIQGLVDTLTARGYLTANQTITLSGDVTGSGTTSITATVVDDSHDHIISNVDFLQDSLDAKANDSDLANYVTIAGTETISGAKTFSTDLDINAKIALNAGDNNIVIGDGAGASLVSGQALQNVLIGTQAGAAIDNGDYNMALGFQALYSLTSAVNNVANGYQALYSDTIGSNNIANGVQALYSNSSGGNNVANGYQSLFYNSTGSSNVANGTYALITNTTGNYNVANGYQALNNNSTGSNNVADGYQAGQYYGSGTSLLTTANGSLFLGSNTRASADANSNEIVIGTNAIGNGSNSVTIGNDGTIGSATSKIVLNGVGSTGGTNSALYITSGGELTTNSSDERLKTNINSLDAELSTLMKLNPVTYNYINNLGKTTFGFIAQELEEYYPDLVFANPISKYKGIHYHLFAPIIIKAIQEQQAIIETQKQKITDLETTIQSLITRIENLENK